MCPVDEDGEKHRMIPDDDDQEGAQVWYFHITYTLEIIIL